MNETTIWLDEKYQAIFEEETRGLERRKKHDPSCTKKDIQGILDNLYIHQGNDMIGRGALGDTVLAATIAAYEQFISLWENESVSKQGESIL
jgi:hypothetical protein